LGGRYSRFAAEYAFANHVEHPLSINLREDAVIGQVDRWLACEFGSHRLRGTISDLAAVQLAEPARPLWITTGKPRSKSPSETGRNGRRSGVLPTIHLELACARVAEDLDLRAHGCGVGPPIAGSTPQPCRRAPGQPEEDSGITGISPIG
jgi:hypothetical protein